MSRLLGSAADILRPATMPDPDGSFVGTNPADAGWDWLSIAAHRLNEGDRVARSGNDEEVLVLVLEGTVAIDVGHRYEEIGGRASVFEDRSPGLVLVEPGIDCDILAATPALVVIASAPGSPDVRDTRSIDEPDVLVETRGSGATTRRIRHLLPPAARAGRLIAFEVVTPAGNWSSFPPHKHDTDDPPREAYLEEVYLYRFAGPTGFAVQRVYTTDRALDATVTARDGDLVLVPRGYHVVAASPGHDCYYLNVMAGPNREWRFTVDPDHAWLMNWDPNRPRME
jgi:5-deoxy-glucuronate isomerase